MNRTNLALLLLAAAGTTLTVASNSFGGAQVINLSGATLSENFTKADGSTNDYIDVDSNGTAGILGSFAIQQLAIYDPTLVYTAAPDKWVIQYRATGSVLGLQELIDYGCPNVDSTPNGDFVGIETNTSNGVSTAYHNRVLFVNGGLPVGGGIFNAANPGGMPVRQLNPGAGDYTATTSTAAGTGIQIDASPLDVPAVYGVTKPDPVTPGTEVPAFDRQPLQLGYGLNPSNARDKATGASTGASQKLATLTGGRNIDGYNPTNDPSVPNANTIYNFSLAYVSIAALVNQGVGKTQITMTEQRYLLLTGRLPSGENLIQATREPGSGTRNGFCNSLRVDPSWGRGDNVGAITAGGSPDTRLVGSAFSPTNKTGSGDIETVVRNCRTAIGYSGAERQLTTLQGSRNEILGVKNDIYGISATEYSRPTLSEVLHNSVNGYRIGGFGQFASIGDPAAESVADGGDNNGHPQMCNEAAADYLNNIRKSIGAFTAFPGNPDNEFMPGEIGAKLFIYPSALDNYNDILGDPTHWAAQTPNANLVTALQSVNALTDPGFATYGFYSLDGQSPNRVTGSYTDGNAGGAYYVLNDSTHLAYNSNAITSRNRIAGDMDGDGYRDWSDAVNLVKAAEWRAGGAAWSAPDGVWGAGSGLKASPEILADFNCDGNLNAADVRMWADGYATKPTGTNDVEGALSRLEGFTRVDNASVLHPGNYFQTTLQNSGASYNPGDSRADVADSTPLTPKKPVPGWAPIASDNKVNQADIDYVYKNFGNWRRTLADAVKIDLSCDMNGDRVVDQADICTILSILETSIGDTDLDGDVDITDINTITTHLTQVGVGFANGDVDGDGTVTQHDLDLATGVAKSPCACTGDLNFDGRTNVSDFNLLAGSYGSGTDRTYAQGDLNHDSVVNVNDFNILAGNYGCGTP